MQATDLVDQALKNINKSVPNDKAACLYQTGFLDSFDLMQLLLEIEMASQLKIDVTTMIEGTFSYNRLVETVAELQR